MKKYMAYNHNDTPLMKEPGAKREAEAEAAKYRNATANPAYVREVDDEPTKEEVKEQYPWRAALLWSVIASMKLGIINDINAGIIPPTVKSFSELHNYVDANEYGGFCIDTFADELIELFGGRDEDEGLMYDYVAFMNEAQNIIDAWIKNASARIEPQAPTLILVN